jgi:polar amino acid transport system substrate-binding protein
MFTKRNLIILLVVVPALLAAFSGCSGCRGSTPEPTPTAVPPTPTPTEEAAKPVGDESWDRVEESGTLRVATAADYPPFEYYDGRFKIDGFDIALVREIATRMGVAAEVRDIAFQGLGTALELGRADVAIAALSITPERQASFDFSNVYYISTDGILTHPDSNITEITDVRQMAGGRIGVQADSVYHEWIQTALIDTGLMAEDQLFLYPKPDQAVADLKKGRLHLVAMDLYPAQLAAQEEGVLLVGQGLNVQRYAIAFPNGSLALRTRLNAALLELQNEGFVAVLAKEYLDLEEDEVIPVPTPDPGKPTPTPAPTAAPPPCYDDLAYVADITFDDRGGTAPPLLLPGQAFVKTWRVRNTGTCTWDSSYTLNYVGGNSPASDMSGSTTRVKGTVAPGAQYDISVNLVAPTAPGVYQGLWQMRSGQGQFYGDRLSVVIEAVSPTPTPGPTATPSPNVNFTVDRTHIKYGDCVTFYWEVQNVKAVYFYQDGQNWQDHGVPGKSNSQECPPATITYYLRVVYADDSSETFPLTIYVEPAPESPQIVAFDATPAQIQAGDCVDLYWDVRGDINTVRILRNNAVIYDGAPSRGSMQDCPPGAGEMAYTLEAVGPGGTSKSVRVINVVQPGPTPTPTPPPTAVPPTATPEPPTATPEPENPLTGTSWILSSMNINQVLIPGTNVTADFAADRVSGSGGCNTYNANYVVDGQAIMVRNFTSSQQACTEEILQQEQLFFTALQSATTYQLAGDQLVLFDSGGAEILRFNQLVATPL